LGDSSFGKEFSVTVFGESHGSVVASLIDGCPAGLPISIADVQNELDRRIPSDSTLVSARREKDEVQILSGVYDGYTTGTPIGLLTWNRDVRSQDYDKLKTILRPGHADYPTRIKFGDFNDLRGGGRASGRMTTSLIMAGAIAKKLLRVIGVDIFAHTIQIYDVKVDRKLSHDAIKQDAYTNSVRSADHVAAERMIEAIRKIREEGDSIGGIVECIAEGVPLGIGEPFFDNLDGDLAKVAFSIPAVKGFEVGLGMKAATVKGSENNDPYSIVNGNIVTLTNNAGGILGGISNGMSIVIRLAFKPPSSIPRDQRTVDLEAMSETTVQITGRHDPCIVPKAVPVVEAAVAIVLVDHCIRSGKIPRVLGRKHSN
jgi:chorismate synthase